MTAADIASCREAAEHCRRLAAKEINPVEKHELQRIADEWLRLAQTPGIVPALNQLAILS
jgi:hypothetical protein